MLNIKTTAIVQRERKPNKNLEVELKRVKYLDGRKNKVVGAGD